MARLINPLDELDRLDMMFKGLLDGTAAQELLGAVHQNYRSSYYLTRILKMADELIAETTRQRYIGSLSPEKATNLGHALLAVVWMLVHAPKAPAFREYAAGGVVSDNQPKIYTWVYGSVPDDMHFVAIGHGVTIEEARVAAIRSIQQQIGDGDGDFAESWQELLNRVNGTEATTAIEGTAFLI
jgi:hypothetical protein